MCRSLKGATFCGFHAKLIRNNVVEIYYDHHRGKYIATEKIDKVEKVEIEAQISQTKEYESQSLQKYLPPPSAETRYTIIYSNLLM